jgi:hypothetical protein
VARRRASARPDGKLDAETLYEGIPAHLRSPLVHWVESLLQDLEIDQAERRAARVIARTRLVLERSYDSPDLQLVQFLQNYATSEQIFAVIDVLLADGVRGRYERHLDELLTDGGSAWRLAENGRSLVRRVESTATDAMLAVDNPTAGSHLRAAWAAVYGRHPDPTRAYSEAIKAVEAASIPVVLPNDRDATLGKVIGAFKQPEQRARWRLAISAPNDGQAEVAVLLDMLRLLWQGQTDRHGGSTPTVAISAPAAEAAVHLAVTLVQWFSAGAVEKVDKKR